MTRTKPITVFAADEQTDEPVEPVRWAALAESVLEAEGVKGETEVSVLFVDEVAIAELNKRFLGGDGPTDVLAFPIDEQFVSEGGRSPDSAGPGLPAEPDDRDLPTLLGDVVICPAVAKRNAPTHAGTYDDELALLLVHGLLHLLGMDHADPDETVTMQSRERDLLERFHRKP